MPTKPNWQDALLRIRRDEDLAARADARADLRAQGLARRVDALGDLLVQVNVLLTEIRDHVRRIP